MCRLLRPQPSFSTRLKSPGAPFEETISSHLCVYPLPPTLLLRRLGVHETATSPISLAKQRAEETFFDKTWLCLTHSFLCLRVREALAGHTSRPKTFSSLVQLGRKGLHFEGKEVRNFINTLSSYQFRVWGMDSCLLLPWRSGEG